MKKMISRRNFLKAAGVSAAALGLAACGGSSSSTAASTASFYRCFQHRCCFRRCRQGLLPELQARAGSGLAGSGQAEYTEETGVPVTVVTAASGQLRDHPDERDGEERSSHPVPGERPCGSGQLEGLLLRPVRQPSSTSELTSDSFALKDGDAVTSIAYVIETYGIIYNKELLSAAGYTAGRHQGLCRPEEGR